MLEFVLFSGRCWRQWSWTITEQWWDKRFFYKYLAHHFTRQFFRWFSNPERYLWKVSVSGDGLLHELLNGLASRDDWDTVLSYSCDFLLPRKNYQIILVICLPPHKTIKLFWGNARSGKICPWVWCRVEVGTQCTAVFCIRWQNTLTTRFEPNLIFEICSGESCRLEHFEGWVQARWLHRVRDEGGQVDGDGVPHGGQDHDHGVKVRFLSIFGVAWGFIPEADIGSEVCETFVLTEILYLFVFLNNSLPNKMQFSCQQMLLFVLLISFTWTGASLDGPKSVLPLGGLEGLLSQVRLAHNLPHVSSWNFGPPWAIQKMLPSHCHIFHNTYLPNLNGLFQGFQWVSQLPWGKGFKQQWLRNAAHRGRGWKIKFDWSQHWAQRLQVPESWTTLRGDYLNV